MKEETNSTNEEKHKSVICMFCRRKDCLSSHVSVGNKYICKSCMKELVDCLYEEAKKPKRIHLNQRKRGKNSK